MLQSNQAVDARAFRPEQTHTSRTLTGLLVAAGLLFSLPASATFFTPGQFDVTPTGAASYSVPIAVPPGTAGMVPSLALAYNSQGGNGLLGMGWSLSGLSAVTRCPKTLAQDNTKSGIQYDANDKYCLDGQRLVAVSGTYGANGTEYRTEREGFSKIVSYGSNGYGPTWFKVWTKSGQIMEFGSTADSAIEAQGKSAIRVWAVNKISDTKGNYLTVTYTKDEPNGQYYPNRIDYTGNAGAGLTPYNSVRFVYATRPDITPLYDGGSIMKTTVRLTNVQTWAKVNSVDTMVKDYRLAYDTSAATQRSRITSLTECDGAAECLMPTTFTWNSAITHFDTVEQWGTNVFNINAGWFTTSFQSRVWPVDVNGDGLIDLLGLDSNYIYMQINTGSGFQPVVGGGSTAFNTNAGWFTTSFHPRVWPVDVNGDGLIDLLGLDSNYIYMQINTGSGFQPVVGGGSTAFNTNAGWFTTSFHPRVWPVDVNGDGLVDLLGLDSNSILVQINTGTGFLPFTVWGTNAFDTNAGWFTTSLQPRVWPVDVNGDGLVDLLGLDSNSILVQINTGTGFLPFTVWGSTAFNTNAGWFTTSFHPRVWPMDVNGDGLVDLLGLDSNSILVQINTGTGFLPFTVWGTNAFDTNAGWFTTSVQSHVWPRDVNGKGMTALLGISDNYIGVQLLHGDSISAGSNRIISITTGLGTTTSIAYKPLTDAGVYTKEATGVYPYLDLQAPIYVVSSVASSNGIGGNYTSNYTYVGGKSHLTGGGFLGFRQTLSTDAQTGIKSTTTYRQDYPHQGLPSSAEKRTSGGTLLNQVTNTWAFTTNPAWSNQYHYPKLTQSVESSYELTGALISAVTTGNTYDSYGNPTQITVSTGDGYSKTTVNTYTNDTANWYLGRLTGATVTSTTP